MEENEQSSADLTPIGAPTEKKRHAASDRRLILCLEGLGTSFAMLAHIHPGLYETCHKIKSESLPMTLALLKCWTFVDIVHRIREIAESIPGLNANAPEVRQFLNATKEVEVCRNYIQHLRGELMKIEPNTFPVWGSISWVDPEDKGIIHMADSGTRVGNITTQGLVYDTHERKWVTSVSLNIEGATVNFDPLFSECVRFRDFIIPWILNTYKLPLTQLSGPNVLSVRFEFKLFGNSNEVSAEYV